MVEKPKNFPKVGVGIIKSPSKAVLWLLFYLKYYKNYNINIFI
jgi:hypothetical protein